MVIGEVNKFFGKLSGEGKWEEEYSRFSLGLMYYKEERVCFLRGRICF